MARPRKYEREEVLERAMELFWLKGYEGTSTAELAEAMGINRATMYAEFRSKHALYLLALQRYMDEVMPGFISELLAEDAGLEAIVAVLERFEGAARTDSGRGCMVWAAASETAPHDVKTRNKVKRYLTTLRAAFRRALANATASGSLERSLDVDAWAARLTTTIIAISVVVRSGVDRSLAEDTVQAALRELTSSRRKP